MVEPFLTKELLIEPVSEHSSVLVLQKAASELVLPPVRKRNLHSVLLSPAYPFPHVVVPALHCVRSAVEAGIRKVQRNADDVCDQAGVLFQRCSNGIV